MRTKWAAKDQGVKRLKYRVAVLRRTNATVNVERIAPYVATHTQQKNGLNTYRKQVAETIVGIEKMHEK